MRNRVLEAAIEVLRERGYSGFRVGNVAETAGVSRGAQLHHFPSKNELVVASLDHVYRRTRDYTLEAANQTTHDAEVLNRACADAEHFFYGDDFFLTLDLVISGNKISGIADEVREMASQNRIAAEQAWVARFVRTGLDPDEAEDILWVLWSVVRGLAVRRQIGYDAVRAKRVTELTLHLLTQYAESRRISARTDASNS